ncbi:MAG TPA: rod shape-determining protein MreC [Bryobacteraceae bacterium]|nr:rod shape-determining protein MreC [Bryobacteraceae bacterium]
MESLFQRYRNVTVLLVVIFAQLILLAWQVKSDNDVPLVRVWAITAVAPVASAIEGARTGTTGFFSNYFALRNAREQSRELRTEVDRLKLENQFLKNELASAQRAEGLAGFQAHTPSKMIGAHVIGATTGMGAKSVLIDRGMAAGVKKGMAVVTPDGIVGKVLAVYPFASQVLAVTDPGFAAGVESQRNHTFGVLKGQGNGAGKVDYVPDGQKVDVGEMFYTSGEDRVFPKGLPVGKVTSVAQGADFQNILVRPSGIESAPEEVLVIVDPVHQAIPEAPPAETPVYLAPPLTGGNADPAAAAPEQATPADRLMEQYKKIGDAQKHTFGEGGPGTPPPNFNLKMPGVNAPAESNAPKPSSPPAAPPAATTSSSGAPPARSAPSKSAAPESGPQF